jgi:hypothetical protein
MITRRTLLGAMMPALAAARGAGKGKHVVFVVADQEYRSEESMPAFAKLLAAHHGFRCTVLMPRDPRISDDLPGLEALDKADLMVMFLRFQELPDAQMKHIIDYTNSGRPIVALRTSTHAFNYQKNLASPYARYSFRSREFDGGYGRQVLGETWINHYGVHQKESTRGVPAPGMERHPILRGVEDVWGPSDVYAITTLTGDAKPVLLGQVLAGMEPTSPPNPAKKLVPVAWIKSYNSARVFTTTMGHPGDFLNEGFRRMLVNACYWALKMEAKLPRSAKVDFVAPFTHSPIGFRR